MRHGPRISYQNQSKIENVNRVINGVCWSMCLTFENFLREKNSQMTAFCSPSPQMKNDRRSALLRVSGRAFTSQFRFEERMYKRTAVPSGNLHQRWGYGIWVRETPMTDECVILTKNLFRKRNRSTAWLPKRSFWSGSWRKLENFKEWRGREFEVSDWDAPGPRAI